MIAIVDYDAGNIRSVLNALGRVGAGEVCDLAGPIGNDGIILTADPEQLRAASHVILPGVGEASTAMQNLRDAGLADFIPKLTQPVLGICVGAQLMCAGSEEGDTRCMGIFSAEVRRFKETPQEKVPHMGWNSLREPFASASDMFALRSKSEGRCCAAANLSSASATGFSSPLFAGLKQGEYVYFVHSYYPEVCDNTIAVTNHGIDFSAALNKDNFFACQFHPEKSGTAGEQILKNFLAL